MRWLVLAAVLASAPAGADVAAPRRVTSALHGTRAAFVVTVRAALDGDAFPAASLEVGLPGGGIVTRATAIAGGREHRLALLEAEAASAAFDGLGAASGDDKPSGVLVTAAGDSAQIEFAAPAAGAADIVLEIEAPTCFAHDARWVQVPESWRDVVPAAAKAPPGCESRSDGPWLSFGAPAPAQLGTIAGRLSVTSADVARVEIDLARELGQVPADLETVIVVDASRSLTADEREAQRAIIASYVRLVPHTRVQLLGYARDAQPLLPGWQVTDAAAPRIDRELRALIGRNGSNIDRGIAAAGEWLARAEGTRRVLVFTDERLAARFESTTGQEWSASLPAATLVHVIALRGGQGPLVRDDDVRFGELAKATGGIGVDGTDGPGLDATLLVRPISLDQIAVEGAGWAALGSECPMLPAGTSCTWFGLGQPSAGPITVAGSLWNQRITRVVRPDPTSARAIARELSVLGGLEAPLQAEIDHAAMAVDAVWSLYGRWGGDGGYAERLGFGHTSGTIGGVSSSTIVDTIGIASRLPELDLKDQLAGPIAACGDVHGDISIFLTREEIVDVSVSHAGAHEQCIEDAVWNTLVAVPDAAPRSHAHVVL